jgi:pimeloyl-ACP methyl ester carboxylesterase
LRKLGVDAQFRPRNDIEVDGRKISGTGGVFDGDIVFFQGTLLVDFDVERMIAALKVPVDKLARHDVASARQRVVSLTELFGEAMPDEDSIRQALLDGFAEGLGIAAVWGEITAGEEALAQDIHDDEIGGDDFVAMRDVPEAGNGVVTASLTRPAGTLRADIRLEGSHDERIREVLLSGDAFVSPARTLYDLEAALRGVAVADAGATVDAFFASHSASLGGLAPADFRKVVEAALQQLTFEVGGHRLRGHWIGPREGQAPALVFLHEALGCSRLWRDVPHAIAKATGLGALVYDRLGSGDSDPLSLPHSRDYLIEEATQSLPCVLDALSLERVILVGHSDGATIALIAAGAMPERIAGVVALAPHLFSEPQTLAAIRSQIEAFESGDLKQRLARYHASKTETLFARLVDAWTGGGLRHWGAEPWLAQIRCPVLAIRGTQDPYFSAAQTAALQAAISGALETLALPDCGHSPHQQARQATLAAATAFVRDIVNGPALAKASKVVTG